MEILSLVNFDNPKRVQYLAKSFGSFYSRYPRARHFVLDSSKQLGAQLDFYKQFGIQHQHCPGMPYGERLRRGVALIQSDYFLFFPDDFVWIFTLPLDDVIVQSRRSGVHLVKLCARGMPWYAQKNPQPQAWFHGNRLISGERLAQEGDMFISKRRWIRNFHEQFSLACGLFQTEFARWCYSHIPTHVLSPGQAEKRAYLALLVKRYYTAYYRMQVPTFHFVDLAIEGQTEATLIRAGTNLLEENYEIYNRTFNAPDGRS